MFLELLPLLSENSLVLSVCQVQNELIRVTINPRPRSDKTNAASKSLPFTVEGTAQELDEQLSQAIKTYVPEHIDFTRSLEEVKASSAAQVKAAKEEAAQATAASRKTGSKASSSFDTKKAEPAKASVPAKPPEPPRTLDLFDVPEPEPAQSPQAEPAQAVAPAKHTESTDTDVHTDEELFLLEETNEDAIEDEDVAA